MSTSGWGNWLSFAGILKNRWAEWMNFWVHLERFLLHAEREQRLIFRFDGLEIKFFGFRESLVLKELNMRIFCTGIRWLAWMIRVAQIL